MSSTNGAMRSRFSVLPTRRSGPTSSRFLPTSGFYGAILKKRRTRSLVIGVKSSFEFDDFALRPRRWQPHQFATKIVVDEEEYDSPTHEVDCIKSKVAIELEWNNKTEFYDRALNNFRRLFELQVSDVGVIITRCDELQAIFNSLGRGKSYGSSTTILSKLKRKLDGGAGGGCPVLAVGMKSSLYLDDVTNPSLSSRFVRIARPNRASQR